MMAVSSLCLDKVDQSSPLELDNHPHPVFPLPLHHSLTSIEKCDLHHHEPGSVSQLPVVHLCVPVLVVAQHA